MERKEGWIKVEGVRILWAVMAVLLCAAPSIRAGSVYDSGPINDPPGDGYYWITTGVTVDLYASGSYQVHIDGGGTVNFQTGSSAGGVSAYVGSQLNMYGGTVTGTISVEAGVNLTIYGAYDSMISDPIGEGHWDATNNQVVVDDPVNGWNGDLTFTYEGNTDPTTITFSTRSNIKFTGGGEEPEDPVQLIQALVAKVKALNLQNGIDNSLDAKLDAASNALDDLNQNNDVAAINTLQAFINAVEAQSGNKILFEDSEELIADAQAIIDLLSA